MFPFLGVFQLKQARAYSEEHCSTTHLNNHTNFPLQTCNTDPQLIRIRFQSRHSNSKSYYTYVQFSTEEIRTAAVTVQLVIDKLVYAHIVQLQYGSWDINVIKMKLQKINHLARTWTCLMIVI